MTDLGPGTVSGASVADSFPSIFGNVSYGATQVGGASGFTASGTGNISDVLPSESKITYTAKGKVSSAATGTLVNYTITVTNIGPSNVSGAVISDIFPTSFTNVTYIGTQTGGATGFPASGSGNINDTLAMSAAAKIIYKATGRISASATGSMSNKATVTSPSGVPDPNTANNSAIDTETL